MLIGNEGPEMACAFCGVHFWPGAGSRHGGSQASAVLRLRPAVS
jgi:hypothetical protein